MIYKNYNNYIILIGYAFIISYQSQQKMKNLPAGFEFLNKFNFFIKLGYASFEYKIKSYRLEEHR